jgi:DNA-directed RNA polymerase specialized sigma subunit
MLSSHAAREINNQIRDELRIVDRITTSHQEKMEALERIAKLKQLLESPTQQTQTRGDILNELATALVEAADARNCRRPTSLFEALFGADR